MGSQSTSAVTSTLPTELPTELRDPKDTFFSTKSGGSGLGLPTARKIIEAHGGQIQLQSERGHGTQFTIKLPVPARLPAATDFPAG